MRILHRPFGPVAALFVLIVSFAGNDAKAGAIYRMTLAITDDTAHVTTVFTVSNGGPNDTNPSADGISVSAALNTSPTGVSLTGINSTTQSTSAGTSLGVGGEATVAAGSTDVYTIVITTTHDSYSLPTGLIGTLGQSESGTYTYTNSGTTQGFQSWYNPGSAGRYSRCDAGPLSISIPATTLIPPVVRPTRRDRRSSPASWFRTR